MTAETILQKSVRYDRGGKPVEVVIPYEQFIDFIETYGLDLSEEEKEDLREAIADREKGRNDRFVSAEEAKREFGL
jgi:PHD/YefM family antitoxin component YafN of YafNO toxin-antitoxin module